MVNDLRNYDFIEGTTFEPLMPKVLEQAPGTVGEAETNVRWMGFNGRGSDSLEVVDIEKFFDEGDGGNGGDTDQP